MLSARALAARILARVVSDREHLDFALTRQLDPNGEARDNALVRELCYGVMRWYYRFDFILQKLLEKPLKNRDTDIRMLLMCGLYQLDFLRTPDHAAISASVEAAKELKKPWAASLINALLRRYQRETESLAEALAGSPQARYAHPAWLIDALRDQWPQHWESILEGNNQRPPLHLRVNLTKISRDEYLQMLHQENIQAAASDLVGSGIHIPTPMDVNALPGFQAGLVSVQDFGAQLSAGLLDIRPRQRILDACAAPGGKTGHIAEAAPASTDLIAVERDPGRLELLRQTCRRLGLNAKAVHSDIIHKEHWWDGRPFDRILLDVPCSATGVIRRHPDIKFLRTPDQIAELKALQRQILEAVWPTLETGGKLLYVTCSVLKQEGEEQIRDFMQDHPKAQAETIIAGEGVPLEFGRQLLPSLNETDGFYYARLLKTG